MRACWHAVARRMKEDLVSVAKRRASRLLEGDKVPIRERHTLLALHVNLRRAQRVTEHCVLNGTRSTEDIVLTIRYWREATETTLGPSSWD